MYRHKKALFNYVICQWTVFCN